MASRVLAQVPWVFLDRGRVRFDILARSILQTKQFSAFQLDAETPAMEALKDIPYPTTALDPSVFEYPSEEYDSIGAHPLTHSLPRTSIETLVNLVARKRYKTAERIRSELLQMGVEIPLNPIYEQAAIAALRTPNRKTNATAFSAWFSLVPMARDSKPRSFNTISQLLFYKPLTADIPPALQFGLICASKGYARKVASRVIPFVVRFEDPSVSHRFLHDFETLAAQYLSKTYPTKLRKMLKDFRGLAIRTHCFAGRPAEAVKIFQTSRACNIRMSRFTGAILLRCLEENLNEAYMKLIKELRLRPHYSHSDRANAAPTGILLEVQLASLASKIKMLRRSLVSQNPPTARILCDIMLEYRATGRSLALTLLRKKAFQHSHQCIRLWVTAEMLYHMRRKQHSLVVVAYITHFHLVGVPRDLILHHLEQSSKIKEARPWQFQSLVPRHYPMTGNIIPTSMITTLLWGALAVLSKSVDELENVYSQLLQFARLNKQPTSPSTELSSPSSSLPYPASPSLSMPPGAIDKTHFVPFIRLFTQRSGPNRALAVLGDMFSLDIEPDAHHYTAPAVALARAGNVDATLALLDQSEQVGPTRDQSSDLSLPPHSPTPTLATYARILRAFVLARRVDAATEIDRRIVGRLNYVPGSHPSIDRARSLLRRHQKQRGISNGTTKLHTAEG